MVVVRRATVRNSLETKRITSKHAVIDRKSCNGGTLDGKFGDPGSLAVRQYTPGIIDDPLGALALLRVDGTSNSKNPFGLWNQSEKKMKGMAASVRRRK